MGHLMSAFFKLPTQEFAVKMGFVQAGIVQVLAMILLVVMVFRFDGPSVNAVLTTLEGIAIGNAAIGGIVGGIHVLRNGSAIPAAAPAATSVPSVAGGGASA